MLRLESFRFWDEYDCEYEIFSVVRAREPASFWRENMIAVVILLRHLERDKLYSVWGFIILRPGDGLSFFTKDNSANFLVKKKCNEAFLRVYNLRIREKTLSQISHS